MSWKRKLEKSWGRLGMKYRLEEIVDVTMGQSPKSEYYNTEKNGYPFLQGNRTFGFKYPTFDTYTTVVTKFAKAGDVIMSVRAPVGALNITPVDMCLGRGVCSLRMKNGNQSFLFYMMKYYVSHLLKKESGTVFGSVNRNDINSLEVDIPEDVEEQKRIARYLEMIDDKIELNTAINNNLEEQAQAYFDKLFVVNADPNWPECTLSDIGSVIAGGTPSKSKPEYYADRGIAWITPKDLSVDKSKFISRGENDISELGFSKSSATKMPAGTILFSSRAPIGYIAIAQNEVTTNQGFKSVIPNENIGTAYVYFLLKNLLPTIEGMASGSTFKEISGAAMKSVPTVIPNDNTIRLFSNLCEPIFKEQEVLESENKHLSTLRDSLLQKLISGEIDVSDPIF